MSVRIVIDSAADLTAEDVERLGVTRIPLKVYFGEEEFLDGITMSKEDFFRKLTSSEHFPTTSQISPYDYEQIFTELTADGSEVLVLALSSKLSGCYQSANIAASEFDGKVAVVDTENATLGERILVELAVKLAENPALSAAQIKDILDEKKKKIRLYAILDTLEYLRKGGRISAVTAIAGTLLNIKPLITLEEGLVEQAGQARGTKSASAKLVELIKGAGEADFDLPYSYAYSGLDSKMLEKFIADHKDLVPDENPPITTIGAAIGTHVGPGAIALAFFIK